MNLNLPALESIVETLISREKHLFDEAPVAYSYLIDSNVRTINVIAHREGDILGSLSLCEIGGLSHKGPLLTLSFKGVTKTFNETYKRLVDNIRFTKGIVPGWVIDYPEEDMELNEQLLLNLSDGITPVKSEVEWPLYKSPILNDLLLGEEKVGAYLDTIIKSKDKEEVLSFWVSNVVTRRMKGKRDSVVLRAINYGGNTSIEFLTETPYYDLLLEDLSTVQDDITGSYSINTNREIGNIELLTELIDSYKVPINI
jgi:hypothetical protein